MSPLRGGRGPCTVDGSHKRHSISSITAVNTRSLRPETSRRHTESPGPSHNGRTGHQNSPVETLATDCPAHDSMKSRTTTADQNHDRCTDRTSTVDRHDPYRSCHVRSRPPARHTRRSGRIRIRSRAVHRPVDRPSMALLAGRSMIDDPRSFGVRAAHDVPYSTRPGRSLRTIRALPPVALSRPYTLRSCSRSTRQPWIATSW